MPEANGVPIRLVHENGSLTELMATSINLNVDRKISGHSFPFSGGRLWGLEFNVPNTMIEIEGIFTDDRNEIGATGASATLDFSTTQRATISRGYLVESFITTNNMVSLVTGATKIELKDGSGVSREIPFVVTGTGGASTSDVAYDSGTSKVVINSAGLVGLGAEAASEKLAQEVQKYIDGKLSTHFTTSLEDSEINPTHESVVKITQKVKGKIGNNIFPHWTGSVDEPYEFLPCAFTTFSGGSDGVKKSAGDKVQDMYGILNNSSRHMVDPATSGRSRENAFLIGGSVGDYIVGIQIPYNSMIQAEAGGDKYVPRNFFRRTGATTKITEKGSAANNVPVNSDFTTRGGAGTMTGMQGAVHKMDINYEAGEAVYGFVLLFAPIDAIL